MTPAAALRAARPTDELEALLRFYRDGLGLEVLALEFTHQRGKTVGRAPTGDHLLVLYLHEWRVWAEAVMAEKGRTFEDPDGDRLVLQNAGWPGCDGRAPRRCAPGGRAPRWPHREGSPGPHG